MSNSPLNRSELAKTVSVDDGHVNTPGDRQSWKSLWHPKKMSNSAQNGPESVKIVSVDDPDVNAPQSSSIVEITQGPQNSQ